MQTKAHFENLKMDQGAVHRVAAKKMLELVKHILAGVMWLAVMRAEAGTWTPVASTNSDSHAIQLMLLLTDGTVMCYDMDRNWYKLTPDTFGSYVNGTWTTLAPMTYSRLFMSSQVLRDGRVFIAGGEYGDGMNNAEIYDPLNNSWFTAPPSGQTEIGDAPSMLLPDGRVLIGPTDPTVGYDTIIYDPVGNSWSDAGLSTLGTSENIYVKLPDDSVMTYNMFGPGSERYIPSLNKWITDSFVPVDLRNQWHETGPSLLLADGRVFCIGGFGHTAFYTPSGNTNKGTWTAGLDLDNDLACADAPGAMLVDGNVFFVCSAKMTNKDDYPAPVSFYEFDPVASNLVQQASPHGGFTSDTSSDTTAFLCLPDGNLLYAERTAQLFVYHITNAPLAAAKPTINSIAWNHDGSLHLTGTKLNGISAGACYGDDLQMDSNYPLVRLTDGSGHVYYARTFNWSSTGVATGNKIVSTEFTLPQIVYFSPGSFSLVAVANGVSSDPVTFYAPVWVDFTWPGLPFFPETGDYYFPYNTLAEGVAAVAPGGTIALKPGSHMETMTITKPMLITAVGGAATIGK